MKKNLKEDFQYMPNQNFEAKHEKKHHDKSNKKQEHKHKKTDKENEISALSDEKQQELQSQLEEFFKRDGVDVAPYAYKMFHVEVSL